MKPFRPKFKDTKFDFSFFNWLSWLFVPYNLRSKSKMIRFSFVYCFRLKFVKISRVKICLELKGNFFPKVKGNNLSQKFKGKSLSQFQVSNFSEHFFAEIKFHRMDPCSILSEHETVSFMASKSSTKKI
jgi:hypothetical protein